MHFLELNSSFWLNQKQFPSLYSFELIVVLWFVDSQVYSHKKNNKNNQATVKPAAHNTSPSSIFSMHKNEPEPEPTEPEPRSLKFREIVDHLTTLVGDNHPWQLSATLATLNSLLTMMTSQYYIGNLLLKPERWKTFHNCKLLIMINYNVKPF